MNLYLFLLIAGNYQKQNYKQSPHSEPQDIDGRFVYYVSILSVRVNIALTILDISEL